MIWLLVIIALFVLLLVLANPVARESLFGLIGGALKVSLVILVLGGFTVGVLIAAF